MQCPVCSAELTASRYEGLPVFHCRGCDGYLVATKRVTDIKRRRQVAKSELIETASIDGDSDSTHRINCPRCKRKMKKEKWPRHQSFHIDECESCDCVWFDAGELARLQLDYELSPQGQDAARMQQRHEQMTDEEKEEFQRNLAKLPEGDASFASAFGRGLSESFGQLLLGRWGRRWR